MSHLLQSEAMSVWARPGEPPVVLVASESEVEVESDVAVAVALAVVDVESRAMQMYSPAVLLRRVNRKSF
jgi:hypothetical protein